MPLIFVEGEEVRLVHYQPEQLAEEQRAMGVMVSETDLNPPEAGPGLRPVMFWRNNQIEWDFVEAEDDERDILQAVKIAARSSVVDKIIADSMSDEEVVAVSALFPHLRVGMAVSAGEVYRHKGALVEIIQGHTTQQDWLDAMDASLYKEHRPAGAVSDWVQPTGAHDAYGIGELVAYNGQTYSSKIAANTTVPGSDDRWWELVP